MKLYILKSRPLPFPFSWRILKTCFRRVTLPFELARIDKQLEKAERAAWTIGRLRRLAEFDSNVEGADRLAEESIEVCRELAELKRRQRALELEERDQR